MYSFRIVKQDDLGPLFGLKVKKDQRGFVAPNAVSIAQAAYDPSATAYGIWADKQPVGFMSICDMAHPQADLDEGDNPDGVYVWRLLVDKRHQGKGVGRAALEFAEEQARQLGRAHLALSAVDAPNGAVPFYEMHGFKRSGRIVDGEVELLKDLTQDR